MKQYYFFLILFVLCAFTAKSQSEHNLILNGDFELGNQGFTTEYTDGKGDRWGLYFEGRYVVVHNAGNHHSDFRSIHDHTKGDGSGLYMAVNGTEDTSLVVWAQTVIVKPNTKYKLSFWGITLTKGNTQPAILQFMIDGQSVGTTFTPPNPVEDSLWCQHEATWTSAEDTSIELSIRNWNIGMAGNDFGIDDISMKPMDTVAVYDTICQGVSYTDHGFYLPTQTQPGTYIYNLNLTNMKGADSVVSLYLTVNYPDTTTFAHTTCGSYVYKGEIFTESGNYFIPYTSESGCDAIDNLNLTISSASTIYVRDTVLVGEIYAENGFSIETFETGDFQDTLYLTSSFGCDSIVILLLNVISDISIEQYVQENMVEISPNPTTHYVTIRTNDSMEKIEIFTMNGKVFETKHLHKVNEEKIDVSSYVKGIYFLKVTTSKGAVIKKLIVQ